MNDIKRYDIDGTCTANGQISVFDYESDAGRYVRYQDHIKAMEAKSEEISFKGHYISELRETIAQQSREINRLKGIFSSMENLYPQEFDAVVNGYDNFNNKPPSLETGANQMTTIILILTMLTPTPINCDYQWRYGIELRQMYCIGDLIFKGGFDAKD